MGEEPTTEALCEQCGGTFQYRSVGRARRVCPSCQKRNARAGVKRCAERLKLSPTEESIARLDRQGLTGITREEIALAWNLTPTRIAQIERSALAKVRKHPEARRLFALWKIEGAPVPRPADAGQQLLDWQSELMQWREGLALLQGEPECQEEAKELEQVLDAFQAAVWKGVEEFEANRNQDELSTG